MAKEFEKRNITMPEDLLNKKTPAERNEAMIDGLLAVGLDPYYAPEPYGDEKSLTKEEWKEARRAGIGGSDAGVILGLSKWKSIADLAMDKLGLLPEEEISPTRQFIFDSGHAMEPVVANLFAAVSGFNVHADERMFRHPLYPFMCANCDFLATDKDGVEVGVEIKCTSKDNIWAWGTGVLGDGRCRVGNDAYITQCQHYMAVMNYDRWYLAVGVANSPDDLKIIRVDRNYEYEKALIDAEKNFWETYVMNGVIPSETSLTSNSYDARIAAIAAAHPDAGTAAPINLPNTLVAQAREIERIKVEKGQYSQLSKELEEKENLLKVALIDALGDSALGYIQDSDDPEYRFEVSYKAPANRTKFNEDLLALECPEVLQFLKDNGYLETTAQKPRFTLSHKRNFQPKKKR